MEDFSIIKELLGDVAFPIAITLFVMVRLESKITKMNECIKSVIGKIDTMIAIHQK